MNRQYITMELVSKAVTLTTSMVKDLKGADIWKVMPAQHHVLANRLSGKYNRYTWYVLRVGDARDAVTEHGPSALFCSQHHLKTKSFVQVDLELSSSFLNL